MRSAVQIRPPRFLTKIMEKAKHPTVKVKICGIKEILYAIEVAKAGADFVGFVFAPSKRQITPEKAQEIIQALRKEFPAQLLTVGVFVNTSPDEINAIADFCNLDIVQLSGNEPKEYFREIKKPIIKAVHLKDQSVSEILAEIEAGYKYLGSSITDDLVYLLDSQVKGMYGGTGKTFDWNLAREVASQFPVILAGGLSPENVSKAVKKVSPWGIDVSSGVETNGVKDVSKIKKFIKMARSTK